MQRRHRWQHRLIAPVGTLLMLSVLLGDTDTGQAFATMNPYPSVQQTLLACGSEMTGCVLDDLESGRFFPSTIYRVEPQPAMRPNTLAGLPPWSIYAPSPIPRNYSTVCFQSVVRLRAVDTALSAWAPPEADLAPKPYGVYFGWPEPFDPLDQLTSVQHCFPRPPPH